jgi:hypothetical protein
MIDESIFILILYGEGSKKRYFNYSYNKFLMPQSDRKQMVFWVPHKKNDDLWSDFWLFGWDLLVFGEDWNVD